MRLKNVPGSQDAIDASKYTINEPTTHKGSWNTIFRNNHPIRIEVGMGKGQFILQLAQQNPDINYIGIEKYSSVLIRALEKQEQYCLNNLFLIKMNAEDLAEVFDKNEVDKIYLNFSDPWPKDRHSKRRLTSAQYLDRYDKILKQNGTLEFKTDNKGLFEFSLEQMPYAKWNLLSCTYDLHNDESMNEGNIMTEYEEKFSALGNPIYKLIANR